MCMCLCHVHALSHGGPPDVVDPLSLISQDRVQKHEDWAVSDIKPRPLYDERDRGSVARFNEIHADDNEMHECVETRMRMSTRMCTCAHVRAYAYAHACTLHTGT